MTERRRNPVDISLYAIADPNRCLDRPLDLLARDAMSGGATLIQYRDKPRHVRTGAGNQRSAVGQRSAADRQRQGGYRLRRQRGRCSSGTGRYFPERCARDPGRRRDHRIFGQDRRRGVFDTASKDNPTAIGIDGWKERAAVIRARDRQIPIGAIAGIDQSNIADLIAAGADGVAVISAIFMAEDAEDATRVLRQIIDGARQTRH